MKKKLMIGFITMLFAFILIPKETSYAAPTVGTVNNLVASSTGGSEIDLTWDKVANVTGYIIYQRVGNGEFKYLTLTTANTYSVKNTNYDVYSYYRVYPYIKINGVRYLGKSGNYVYAKPKVGAVSNLKCYYTGSTSAKITWSALANADGYIIYKKTGSDTSFKYYTMTSKTEYTDSSVSLSTNSYYRIYPYKTVNGKRTLGQSVEYVYPKVKEASSLKAKVGDSRQITLSWTKSTGADGYIIYRKRADESKFSYVGMTSSATWTNTNLKPDTFYFYRVYAYKTVNGKRVLAPSTSYVYGKATSKLKLSGLTYIDGSYYYYLSNGSLRKGFGNWSDIGKAYFDETTGAMQLGITTVKSNGNTYNFKKFGGVYTGFCNDGENTYYFNPSTGVLVKGYTTIDGKKYYLDPETGAKQTGFQTITLSNGKYTFYFLKEGGVATGLMTLGTDTYYFSASGVQQSGYVTIDKKKYYFDPTTYKMQTGFQTIKLDSGTYTFYFLKEGGVATGLKKIGTDTYYFSSSGVQQSGYVTIDNKKYYFDPTTYKMKTGFQTIKLDSGTYTFYFLQEGGVATGVRRIGEDTYYFSSSGVQQSGYVTVDNKKYYFDPTTYKMKTGFQTIKLDSGTYTFYFLQEGGVYTGIQTIEKKKYYFSPTGVLTSGYVTVDNKKYYFDPETYVMQTGFQTITLDSGTHTFYFLKEGGVYSGLQAIGSDVYYFSPDGAMQTGYVLVSDVPYYFNNSTGKMMTGKITAQLDTGTFTFYFLPTGGIYKGFKTIDDQLYYFNADKGEMVCDTMMVLNDKKFYFAQDGAAVTGIQYVSSTGLSYYFDAYTALGVRTGIQEYNGDSYYLNTETGVMNFGFWSIGSDLYFFDRTNGKMSKNTTFVYNEVGIKFTANTNGKLSWTAASGHTQDKRTLVIMAALEKIGYPYRTDETGYVCSSLVAYAYSQIGYDALLGIESFQQALVCQEKGLLIDATTTTIASLKPGDLVFWQNSACEDQNCDHWKEIHHVGIYIGNGQMVEASEMQDIMLVHNITENDTFKIMYYADIISSL